MNSTIIIISTGIIFYLLTCLAIFDIMKKDFDKLYKKALWGAVIVLLPFIGTILYFIFGCRKNKININ